MSENRRILLDMSKIESISPVDYSGIYRSCPQWDETKERFKAWWRGGSIDRPLIWLRGIRPEAESSGDSTTAIASGDPVDPFTKHADSE